MVSFPSREFEMDEHAGGEKVWGELMRNKMSNFQN